MLWADTIKNWLTVEKLSVDISISYSEPEKKGRLATAYTKIWLVFFRDTSADAVAKELGSCFPNPQPPDCGFQYGGGSSQRSSILVELPLKWRKPRLNLV